MNLQKGDTNSYKQTREGRQWWHCLFTFFLLLVIGLFIPFRTLAQQEHLSASEAIDAVRSSERLEPDLMKAQPREAKLYYQIDDRTGRISPMKWIVVMENRDGQVQGLVGIDARTGDFLSETFVSQSYTSPRFNRTKVRQDLRDIVPLQEYNMEDVKLVFIGGAKIAEGNYWLIPHQSDEVGRHIVFPAFGNANIRIHASLKNVGISPLIKTESGRPYYEFGNGLLQQDQTGKTTENRYDTGIQSIEQGSGPMSGKIKSRSYRDIPSPAGKRHSTKGTSKQQTLRIKGPPAKVHLDEVPLYYQGNTWGCGMFSLAMVHQWWSPVDLGNPFEQVWEIALYKGRATAKMGPQAARMSPSSVNDLPAPQWWGTFGPQYPKNLTDVMKNWDQLSPDYQDYQTVSSNGANSLSDLKFWIKRGIPGLVFVNSDNGSVGFLDHWVVVTGFDDNKNKLHLNNSGAQVGASAGSKGTVDYNRFDNSYWEGLPKSADRYLLVGYPGDRDRSSVSVNTSGIAGTISDDEFQDLKVSMSVKNDATKFGQDSFGDGGGQYHTGIDITFTQGEGLFGSINNGAFDKHAIDPRSSIEFLRMSRISPGTTIGRLSPASVSINPANRNPNISSLGTNSLEITAYTYDEDDRSHSSSEQIKTYNFAPNSNCDTDAPHSDLSDCYNRNNMPKPLLERTTQTHTETYQVKDDVSDAPDIVDVSPRDSSAIGNSYSGLISLRPNFSTYMGSRSYCCDYKVISEAVIHYRVLDSNNYIVVNEKTDTTYPGPNKGIAAVVPESQWKQGWKGGKIEWWVEATNTDNDRPGDRESMTSPKFLLKFDEKTGNGGSPLDPEYLEYERVTKAKKLEEAYEAAHTIEKFQDVLDQTGLNSCALNADNCEEDSTFPFSESDLRESNYGGQPEACAKRLTGLFNILESSATKAELNSSLDRFQGNTQKAGPQCQSIGSMKVLSGNLNNRSQYKISGRVINKKTNSPLKGFGVHATDMESSPNGRDIGLDVTDGKGNFAFTYIPTLGAGDKQSIRFTVTTQAGQEVATRNLDIQLEQSKSLKLLVTPPEPSGRAGDVPIESLPVDLSANLENALEDLEHTTLGDVRSAGGISSIGKYGINHSDSQSNGLIDHAVNIVRTMSVTSAPPTWKSFAFVTPRQIDAEDEWRKGPVEMGLRGFLTVLATSDSTQGIGSRTYDGALYGALLGTFHEIQRETVEDNEQHTTPQPSGEVAVSLVPRGGISLPNVSSLGDVAEQAQSTLTGVNSVVTWGASLAFGSRDDVASFRLTGLYRKGKVSATLQNDQITTTEIDENFTAFTGDLVLRPLPWILVQPYVIGGFGVRNVSYGGQYEPASGSGWKPVAQLGVGVDLNIGTQDFFVGLEMIDYMSNFSNDGSLRHDAFLLGTVGIPLF